MTHAKSLKLFFGFPLLLLWGLMALGAEHTTIHTAGVIADHDLKILAGRNLDLLAAENTQRIETHSKEREQRRNDYNALMNLGATLAGTAAGALIDGTQGAATAATAASEGLKNNFLGHRDQARLKELRGKNPEEMSAQEKNELRTLEEYNQQSDYLLAQLRNGVPLSDSDQALLNRQLSRYAQQDGIDAARELLISGAPYVGNYGYPFALGPYQAEYDKAAEENGLGRPAFRPLEDHESIASWLVNPLVPRPEEERNYNRIVAGQNSIFALQDSFHHELSQSVMDGLVLSGTDILTKALIESVIRGVGVVTKVTEEVASGVKGGLGFATEADQAFFWSGMGRGGDKVAAELAAARGGTTLEQLTKTRGVDLPAWDAANPASVQAWQNASRAYAEGASGTVRAVIGDSLRPGSVWETIELPALRANPNVTQIIRVHPTTGAETVIFSRSGL